MNELDLIEILKDCPKDTKLYSTIYGEVYFKGFDLESVFPITFKNPDGYSGSVTNKGLHCARSYGECTLFPSKDQRDWSKWQRPFVDGDIIFTYIKEVLYDNKWLSIFRRTIDNRCETYVDMNISDRDFYINEDESKYFCNLSAIKYQRFATDEEKKRLFDAIKEHGYSWNAEKKELEKIIKDKFDTKKLKPFDKVLAKQYERMPWCVDFYSYYDEDNDYVICTDEIHYNYCIPYNDDTAHLVGTDKEAPEYYRYWED